MVLQDIAVYDHLTALENEISLYMASEERATKASKEALISWAE